MKVKVRHLAYVNNVIEIDDKWEKLAEIGAKNLYEPTEAEADYYNDNIDEFLSAVDKSFCDTCEDAEEFVRILDMDDNTIWEE